MMIYEYMDIAISAASLERLERVARTAAEAEWEDDRIQVELTNLANECAARLQRIARGDKQAKPLAYTASLRDVAGHLLGMNVSASDREWVKRATEELYRLDDLSV